MLGYLTQYPSVLDPTYAPREVNKNNEAQVHELQYGEYLRQQKSKHKYSI